MFYFPRNVRDTPSDISRGYTKHGDTHITVTPATDYPRASRSFQRIAGSGNEIEPPQLHFNLLITPRALTFIQETSCKLFVNT